MTDWEFTIHAELRLSEKDQPKSWFGSLLLPGLATQASSDDSRKLQVLHFPAVPSTFQEIKEQIASIQSIPTCAQKLYYQSEEMQDDWSPTTFYMRSEDKVVVKFLEYGECEDVMTAVKWLCQVFITLVELKTKITEARKLEDNVYLNCSKLLMDDCMNYYLTSTLFTPWSEKQKQVNCLHFHQLGGVELLITCHKYAIALRSSREARVKVMGNSFETLCCSSYVNLAMDATCCKHLVEDGGLQQCLRSFSIISSTHYFNFLEKQTVSAVVISSAIQAICLLCAAPELQLWLSEGTAVIEQAISYGNHGGFLMNVPLITLLFWLSQSIEMHAKIIKTNLLQEMIHLCEKLTEYSNLKGIAGVFFANIICGSPNLLLNLSNDILNDCSRYLRKVYKRSFSNGDEDVLLKTLEPLLTFLYAPMNLPATTPHFKRIVILHNKAHLILLYFFEFCMRNDHNVQLLTDENLLDYALVLSWNLPKKNCTISRRIWRMWTFLNGVHPPSLITLAKAKLARMKWGLKKMREITLTSELI